MFIESLYTVVLKQGDNGNGVPTSGERVDVVAVDGVEAVVVQLDGAASAVGTVDTVHIELVHTLGNDVDGPLAAGADILAVDDGTPADRVGGLELVQRAGEALFPREADGGGGTQEDKVKESHEEYGCPA